MNTKKLKELGFEKATKKIKDKRKMFKKLHRAYQDYEFVTQEKVNKFNEKLKESTLKQKKAGNTIISETYDKLVFAKIAEYEKAPPDFVLDELVKAREKKCFDEFQIAEIQSVEEVLDPILFGKIGGCGDYFFISQWDKDVTLEMIKNA